MTDSKSKIVAWLLTGCLLIFLMVVVGGVTRLTGSGLSITEWKLIHGTLPPLTRQAWQEEFDQYKQIPQFRHINYNFSLADFKRIFWWEYVHRLLGRIIGLVFVIPFLWFYIKGALSRSLVRQLLFLFFLGGLQGFLGWYMVKSGLTQNLYVSHWRLAIHLVTAFVTFGFTLLVALNLLYPARMKFPFTGIQRFTMAFLVLVVLQVIYGAFVAGLKAGYIYNTFPCMEGAWMHESVIAGWRQGGAAFSDNKALVQFIHRSLGWLLLVAGTIFFVWMKRPLRWRVLNARQRAGADAIMVSLAVQFLLGVLTLVYGVPVYLGIAHQAGAFFLFGSTLYFLHSQYRFRERPSPA